MPEVDKLLPALLKAQGELEHASKSSTNPHFRSKYADLPTIINTIKPVLQKHGLFFNHIPFVENGEQFLKTVIWHAASGQHIEGVTALRPTKQDPQGYGSAITYARRYDLSAMLGLAQDDDDGNAASAKPDDSDLARVTKEIKRCKTEEQIQAARARNKAVIDYFRENEEQLYNGLVAQVEKTRQTFKGD